ncbi:MAG TPA: DUF4124 domain-containing protein [Burkholderiaceae bacterium]|jgi:hypothetical protein|nr:DUF4124 domain-containing protein [Burkholderiaceae bacterium]
MKLVATAVLFAGALLPGLAQAQIYMCKDASGRTLTSDRPIPECANRAMREYGNNGVLKREIAAPPTAEEKRRRQLEEERKKAEEAAAKERQREDRAILARYHKEADIETARQYALGNTERQKKRESASLARLEQQLQQTRVAIEGYEKKQSKPPAGLTRKSDDLQSSVDESRKRIQDQDAELAKINARFDGTLKRFRELSASAPGR